MKTFLRDNELSITLIAMFLLERMGMVYSRRSLSRTPQSCFGRRAGDTRGLQSSHAYAGPTTARSASRVGFSCRRSHDRRRDKAYIFAVTGHKTGRCCLKSVYSTLAGGMQWKTVPNRTRLSVRFPRVAKCV
jgi:hypothetical protein